jgi:hypothetical protein
VRHYHGRKAESLRSTPQSIGSHRTPCLYLVHPQGMPVSGSPLKACLYLVTLKASARISHHACIWCTLKACLYLGHPSRHACIWSPSRHHFASHTVPVSGAPSRHACIWVTPQGMPVSGHPQGIGSHITSCLYLVHPQGMPVSGSPLKACLYLVTLKASARISHRACIWVTPQGTISHLRNEAVLHKIITLACLRPTQQEYVMKEALQDHNALNLGSQRALRLILE